MTMPSLFWRQNKHSVMHILYFDSVPRISMPLSHIFSILLCNMLAQDHFPHCHTNYFRVSENWAIFASIYVFHLMSKTSKQCSNMEHIDWHYRRSIFHTCINNNAKLYISRYGLLLWRTQFRQLSHGNFGTEDIHLLHLQCIIYIYICIYWKKLFFSSLFKIFLTCIRKMSVQTPITIKFWSNIHICVLLLLVILFVISDTWKLRVGSGEGNWGAGCIFIYLCDYNPNTV